MKPVTEIPEEEVSRVAAWINSEEYKEKNFARQALVINPAHACQPLGAELVAHAFEGSLPFVHGSQGCASYYRSTLNRHFREPAPAVSDAMTEDGAVFGGQNNLHEALENAYALYKPKMMPIFTSCMPEIIGDDLTAFIKNARQKGFVPKEFPLPYANTPSFNGSHVHGYDAMLLSILQTLTEGKQVEGRCTGKLNLIAGFDCQHRQLPGVQADPQGVRHPLYTPGGHLRVVRLAPGRHLPDLSRRHQAGRRGRLHQRQGDHYPRALCHRQDLRLDQGQLCRQACLHADAVRHRQDRRVPDEALRAVRQAGPRVAKGRARPGRGRS